MPWGRSLEWMSAGECSEKKPDAGWALKAVWVPTGPRVWTDGEDTLLDGPSSGMEMGLETVGLPGLGA